MNYEKLYYELQLAYDELKEDSRADKLVISDLMQECQELASNLQLLKLFVVKFLNTHPHASEEKIQDHWNKFLSELK